MMAVCYKCGTTENLIKHHVSYDPEIIVDCCRSCHTALKLPKITEKERYISVLSAVRRRYWRQKPIQEAENKKPLVVDDDLKAHIEQLLKR